MPRLLVDGTPISPDPKGVQRYAYQLCLQLPERLPDDWSIQVLIHDRSLSLFPPDWRAQLVPIAPRSELGFALFEMPRQVRRLGPQVLLRTNESAGHIKGLSTATVCHDMGELILKVQRLRRGPLRFAIDNYKQRLRRRALQNSDMVVCNSEFIRAAVQEYYGIAPSRTAVAYCGVDPGFYEYSQTTDQAGVHRRYGTGNFILAFATGDPRENYMRYPALAAKLMELGVASCLLIAGIRSGADYGKELRAEFLRRGLAEGQHFILEGFLGTTRFHDLVDLYTTADFYLDLSLHEGFGMQLVEAMACGTTCISSPAGALVEIGNKYVLFVDPTNIDEIAQMIKKAYQNKLQAGDNSEQVQYTHKFNWDKTGRVITEILMNLAARRV